MMPVVYENEKICKKNKKVQELTFADSRELDRYIESITGEYKYRTGRSHRTSTYNKNNHQHIDEGRFKHKYVTYVCQKAKTRKCPVIIKAKISLNRDKYIVKTSKRYHNHGSEMGHDDFKDGAGAGNDDDEHVDEEDADNDDDEHFDHEDDDNDDDEHFDHEDDDDDDDHLQTNTTTTTTTTATTTTTTTATAATTTTATAATTTTATAATTSQKNYENHETIFKKLENTLKEKDIRIKCLEKKLIDKTNTVEEQTKIIEDLEVLVHTMDKDRRNLHNTIHELKGNIRVFCRVRPKIDKETMKIPCSINYLDECTMEIGRADGSDAVSCTGKPRGTKQEFTFDKIFPPQATQADVFEELSMLVQSALEGYNVCVFAYGETGSGKTYTMEGACNPDYEGMIPRTVRHIFKEIKEFQLLGWECEIEASFLEIYNEHIVDLLDSKQKDHEIRMTDPKGTDLYVTNLTTVKIEKPDELHKWLRTAQQNRAVAATKANDRSSRSHSVARIRLIATHAVKKEMCVGNLNLVDLAGSERLKNEEAARTTETKNINKSLANLGNVILALLQKKDHVPYRNSKLTHLLMPSLGGNSKTLMLLTISPLDECFNETLNSLRFASNVNSCKTGNIKKAKTIQTTNG